MTAYNYTATLVEMSEDFRMKLLGGYTEDPTYHRLIEVLKQNDAANPEDRADLPFSRDGRGLIWHHSDGTSRLCIPNDNHLISDILKIAHTEAGHPGAARTFKCTALSWYI